eukprot:gene8427-biopygen13574
MLPTFCQRQVAAPRSRRASRRRAATAQRVSTLRPIRQFCQREDLSAGDSVGNVLPTNPVRGKLDQREVLSAEGPHEIPHAIPPLLPSVPPPHALPLLPGEMVELVDDAKQEAAPLCAARCRCWVGQRWGMGTRTPTQAEAEACPCRGWIMPRASKDDLVQSRDKNMDLKRCRIEFNVFPPSAESNPAADPVMRLRDHCPHVTDPMRGLSNPIVRRRRGLVALPSGG